jgi:uncharacterized damage-inducible protein DinB
MNRSLLDDAFAHHVWATLRLIDTCLELTPDQLNASAPGTYGPILETMRHLVGSDSWLLSHLTGAAEIDTEHMNLGELRAAMETDERAWTKLLDKGLDPSADVKDVDEAGYERHASIGIRLAQALHHGTDHRSQICTALTTLVVEPPAIDVWAFGNETGRVVDIPPPQS